MAPSEDRPHLPSEYRPIEPEPDLDPDAPKPRPRGEKRAPPPSAPQPPVTGRPAFALPDMPSTVSLVTDSVITRPLAERMASASPDEKIGIVIEPRTDSGIPLEDAGAELLALIRMVSSDPD